MSVFTEGGVVTPGQRLMDIVPERAALLIEAKVSPDDADDLIVGQETMVKFESLRERTLPNLEGRLSRLSADSFVDERTGDTYFTAEVVVPHEQLQLINERLGDDFALRAGMPVQVLIPLRKRTALEYAFEPLTGALWRSFREQ
jgi:HlyD family secretion protein